MLFNSYIFIFFFLPVCIIGYFLLNKTKKFKLGHAFLLCMSLWFYGYYNPSYLAIILVSIAINYAMYLWIKRSKAKKPVLILAIALNLAIFIYFKYMDFFIANINAIAKTDIAFLNIALPLGISFFTFQQLSFVIDSYRGEVPDYDILTYACYVTFFPQLIAGPIVTHDELIPQFYDEKKKHVNWDNMAKGLYMFAMGLAKKVLLADVFGIAVNWGFSDVANLKATNAILVVLGYCFQIYFDFSGYCDMATGIACMLNFDLPQNFNSPYKALTINDFWNRWHMTLSRFFVRYVYIPLGGNRRGNARTYFNLFMVFLLSGFWHGAAWTYVVWSLLNGLFCIITRMFKSFFDKMHPALSWLITFGYFNLTLVFFRAETIADAIEFIKQILYVDFTNIDTHILDAFKVPELTYFLDGTALTNSLPFIYVGIYYFLALTIVLGCENSYEKMLKFKPSVRKILWTAVLIAGSVMSLSGISTFLYFNF